MTIYNILGQRIATVLNEYLTVGEHVVTWDGKDISSKDVGSGIYFYTVQSGDHFASSKMTILR